jgi:Holliday junction resolvase RusA-like endonuclease
MIYHYTLHGIPASKKNSKRIVTRGKRPTLISSKRFMDWHILAKHQILSHETRPPNIKQTKAMFITFEINDKRRRDLTNLAEGVMDLIVDCGVLEDDNYNVVPELMLKYVQVDKSFTSKVLIKIAV